MARSRSKRSKGSNRRRDGFWRLSTKDEDGQLIPSGDNTRFHVLVLALEGATGGELLPKRREKLRRVIEEEPRPNHAIRRIFRAINHLAIPEEFPQGKELDATSQDDYVLRPTPRLRSEKEARRIIHKFELGDLFNSRPTIGLEWRRNFGWFALGAKDAVNRLGKDAGERRDSLVQFLVQTLGKDQRIAEAKVAYPSNDIKFVQACIKGHSRKVALDVLGQFLGCHFPSYTPGDKTLLRRLAEAESAQRRGESGTTLPGDPKAYHDLGLRAVADRLVESFF